MSRLVLLVILIVTVSMTFSLSAAYAQATQAAGAVANATPTPCPECEAAAAIAAGPVTSADPVSPAKPTAPLGHLRTPAEPSKPAPPMVPALPSVPLDPTTTGEYAIDSYTAFTFATDVFVPAPREPQFSPVAPGVVRVNWVSPSIWGYRIVADKGYGYVSCFKSNVWKACFRIVKQGQSDPIIDIHFGKWQKNGSRWIGICNTGKRLNFNPVTIAYSYGAVHDAVYRYALEVTGFAAAAWAITEAVSGEIWNIIQQLPAYVPA